jgi:hypothetical protein
MRVGLDIDGVLANFPQAFIDKANELELGWLFPDKWQDVKWWHIANDNCPKAFKAVWSHVHDRYKFWEKIKPFPYVVPFDFDVDCYITARPIDNNTTSDWLMHHGFPTNAAVITVAQPTDKLAVIQERGLDLFVDDHWETVRQLRGNGVNAVLYEAPYQRGHNCAGLPKIKHLSEVKSELLRNG